jgi:hypothetical protein
MIVSLGAVTVPTSLLAWIQLAELAVAVKTPFNVGATRPREIQLSWAEAGNTRPSTTVTTTMDSSLDIEGLPAVPFNLCYVICNHGVRGSNPLAGTSKHLILRILSE